VSGVWFGEPGEARRVIVAKLADVEAGTAEWLALMEQLEAVGTARRQQEVEAERRRTVEW
jgi:hypothetical protein